jgi:sulfur-oxidizing protein SoxB
MSGERLKEMLENAADNAFNPDPYYRQGGDMIRCAGLSYTIGLARPAGQRISDMTALRSGEPVDPRKDYVIASWACGNAAPEDPPVWNLLERYIARKKTVTADACPYVRVVGA